MKVTVVNNDEGGFDKYVALEKEDVKVAATDAFENVYEANKLTFKKDVQGNMAVPSKEFEFTITLAAKQGFTGDYEESYDIVAVKNGEEKKLSTISVGGTAIVNVSEDDGEIVIKNLPYGVTYTIEETNNYDYENQISIQCIIAEGC